MSVLCELNLHSWQPTISPDYQKCSNCKALLRTKDGTIIDEHRNDRKTRVKRIPLYIGKRKP